MDSLSHDPAAGDIGSQLVEIGSRGLAAGNAATMPTMTGLVSATGPADEDDKDPEDRRDQPSGERLA